jgi:hypothetical protein
MPVDTRRLIRIGAAASVAATLILTGCELDGKPAASTAAVLASPNYARTSTVPGPQRGPCWSADEMQAVRDRMVQQELAVAALQCLYPNKSRAYEGIYTRFLNKFNPDLTENRRTLTNATAKRRIDFNGFITEMTNRSGTRSNTDKTFCTTAKQALDWGVSDKASRLSMVPPPYDFSSEMGVFACGAPAQPPRRS